MHDEDHDPPGFDPARFRAAMRGPARKVVRLPPGLRLSRERERQHKRRQIEVKIAEEHRSAYRSEERIAELKEQLRRLGG